MRRLFTFGCSFTNYMWPTWSDFIATKFDYDENWGHSGAGNFYIASMVYECNQINNFTENDTVLIMLSSFSRYDMILRDSTWTLSGNIYSQTRYSKEFVEEYWSEEFGLYQTWFAVSSIKTLLDKIGCKYKFMCAFDLKREETNTQISSEMKKARITKCYEFLEPILPKNNMKDFIEEKIKNGELYYKLDGGFDYHPTISMHLDWIKQELPEFYDITMDDQCAKWESLIDSSKSKTIENFGEINSKYIKNVNHQFGW